MIWYKCTSKKQAVPEGYLQCKHLAGTTMQILSWFHICSMETVHGLCGCRVTSLLPSKTQHDHTKSPYMSPYMLMSNRWGSLYKHHDNSSLIIISLILVTCMFYRAVFNWVSKVIRVLLWFCFTSLCDWLKHLAPLSQPIRSRTQTNCDLLARVFPRLALVTCICFQFWLVHWIICVCCDWLG